MDVNIYRYKNHLSDGSFIGFFLEYFLSIVNIFSLTIYLIIKANINVIHVSNPPDFFWPLALLSKILGVKFIFDQHDLSPEMFKVRFGDNFLFKILNFNERLTVYLSDSIITANISFQQRLIKKYNIRPEKCVVAYNGPSENFEPIKSEELNDKYKNKKIILYVGLMTVTDNIEIIIEVAKSIVLDEKREDCHFILLGDGDVRHKMEKLAEGFGILKNMTFTGIVDHKTVMQYLFLADVCIAPDLPNGLNEYLTLIKILEYMKAKKAFVSFDLFETKNMAKDSGLYAEDLIDYKNKILFIIDNPDEAAKLGHKGNQIVMNEYLWKYSEKNILHLYKNLLK